MMSKEDASKSLIRYIKSNTFSVYGVGLLVMLIGM